MKELQEEKEILKQKTADVNKIYDVIVAGGGPAGIGAALAAALNGAETLVLEGRSQFGGTATAALWMCINWLFVDNEQSDRGGVHRLLVDKIKLYGELASRPGKRGDNINGGNLDIHPDFLKMVIFELFEQLEIDYQLYSPVTGIISKWGKLKGVEITAREGKREFKGKIMVDASGDGDVCRLAGCEMASGREKDGQHMPLSLIFALSGVDVDKLCYFLEHDEDKFEEILARGRQQGMFYLADWYSFDRTTVPGVISVNNGGTGDINLDGTRSSDLTVGEKLGLKIALDFVAFARQQKIPGLEECYLVRTGDYVSVRDTRRLVGEYVLTEKDIMEGREFTDIVARKFGAVDAVGFESGRRIEQGAPYPYRSLLPKSVDNLLAAGRCGSATFIGHSGGKSMGNMLALGQAAGTAAALAAKKNQKPRNLDVELVQQSLVDMGVDI